MYILCILGASLYQKIFFYIVCLYLIKYTLNFIYLEIINLLFFFTIILTYKASKNEIYFPGMH